MSANLKETRLKDRPLQQTFRIRFYSLFPGWFVPGLFSDSRSFALIRGIFACAATTFKVTTTGHNTNYLSFARLC
jgi:hypothetical protein